MPVEIAVEFAKNGQRYVLGRISPGRYATIDDYSSGQQKNISVHVARNGRTASVYEFPNGADISIRYPHKKGLPLSHYQDYNLDAVLVPGQSFEHPLTTRDHSKGKLIMRYLAPNGQLRLSV